MEVRCIIHIITYTVYRLIDVKIRASRNVRYSVRFTFHYNQRFARQCPVVEEVTLGLIQQHGLYRRASLDLCSVVRTSTEYSTGQNKDKVHEHPVRIYHRINLYQRKILWESQEQDQELLDQQAMTSPVSQGARQTVIFYEE